MKNYVLILLFTTGMLGGCKSNPHNSTSDTQQTKTPDTFYLCDKLITIDTIVKADFDKIPQLNFDTSEAKQILSDSAFVKRTDDTIFFAVANTKSVKMANNRCDDDRASQYTYVGFDKDLRQFIVYGLFYEWFNYILIDKQTGDSTYTCGLPVVSPDKRYFICGNTDLEAGETFNGFELFENKHPPILLCKKQFNEWGPQTIKWISDSILLVHGSVFDPHSPSFEKQVYLRLKIM